MHTCVHAHMFSKISMCTCMYMYACVCTLVALAALVALTALATAAAPVEAEGLRGAEERLARLLLSEVLRGLLVPLVVIALAVAAGPKSQDQAQERILLQNLLVRDVGDGCGRGSFNAVVQHVQKARAVVLV